MANRLNKKNSKSSGKITAEIFFGMSARVVGVYVALMLGLFPLFSTDMYYNQLSDKFYFFFYSTLAAFILVAMILLVGLAGGALGKQKDGTNPLKELFRLKTEDYFILAFFLTVTVSTLSSDWVYYSFWGNKGRMQGMFFYLLILAGWFLVTRFYRFEKKHILLFLAIGILISLWGVTDYFGMDIFGWRADADDYWSMLAFMSSIGNLNTFTAVIALYFGVSAVLSMENSKCTWFFALSFFTASLALIGGSSDNAFLAVAGTFGLLPFFMAADVRRFSRYVLLLSLFVLAMALIGWVTSVWTYAPVQQVYSWGVLLKIGNTYYKKLTALGAAGLVLAVLLEVLFRKNGKEQKISAGTLRAVWGVICLLVIAFLGYCVYDSNTSCSLSFLAPFREYLIFNDRWGTNRGYAWRSSFEFFREFDLFKKLFGSGPETFAIFMSENYYYEMMDFMGVVFDSPHSEPIQMLFTVGILGFVTYYGAIVTGFVKGLGKGGYAAACAFGAAAYVCASLINISVPISTPLFFLILELAVTIKQNEAEV